MKVPRSIVNIVEDAINITLIEQTKGFSFALGCTVENIFFVEFNVRHGMSLPAGLLKVTPTGFGSYWEYNMGPCCSITAVLTGLICRVGIMKFCDDSKLGGLQPAMSIHKLSGDKPDLINETNVL
jgi:hypothetical protein